MAWDSLSAFCTFAFIKTQKKKGQQNFQTYQVGQRDHHEGVSWPDVEIIGLHGELSIDGGHSQLHVAMGDVGLAVVEAAAAEELLSYGGERPIAANDQINLDVLI